MQWLKFPMFPFRMKRYSIIWAKEFKLDTGVFMINTATVKIDPNGMTSAFNPNATAAEQQSFDVAINGSAPSLLSKFS